MPRRITELRNIQEVSNIPSIFRNGGILSNERAAALEHASIAMQQVQDKRARTQVPGGLRLHQYANLYFCARNPMMSARRHLRNELCVLQVNRRILTLEGVVISDRNASSDYVRFYKSPEGIHHIDLDKVYARDWRHENQIEYLQRKSIKCAEILVPNAVPPEYIFGAYVANRRAEKALLDVGFDKPVTIDADMFF